MSYVSPISNAFSKKNHQFYEIPADETNLSGDLHLNQDIHNISQFSSNKFFANESMRVNRHIIETSYINESLHSCSIRATNNPESDTYSRR